MRSWSSARWDHSVDHRGKNLALIGAGASGFQIAPAVADEVATLTVLQRTAQWVFPNANYHRQVPDGLAINERNLMMRGIFSQWMVDQLGDREDLVPKVIPNYPVTATRMLQDNGSWLACLRKPNVELVRTEIERIAEDGVVLRDQWGHEPTAYLGITISNFPNLFCRYGPGTNLAHGGSLIFHSECQMSYVMDALHELLAHGHRTLEPKPEVHDAYSHRYQNEIAQIVWAHWPVKHSHYKNTDGRIFTLSPWPIPQYWGWTKELESDDYVYT